MEGPQNFDNLITLRFFQQNLPYPFFPEHLIMRPEQFVPIFESIMWASLRSLEALLWSRKLDYGAQKLCYGAPGT